jgi:hypothetical protein
MFYMEIKSLFLKRIFIEYVIAIFKTILPMETETQVEITLSDRF